MSSFASYQRRLADRAGGLPPMAVDVLIAAGCWFDIDLVAVLADRLYWWVPPLGLAYCSPLLLRRRYPLAVTAVIGVGSTILGPTGLLGEFPAAGLVVTYTFAALCPPVKRLIAVVGTVVGITMSIVIPGDKVVNLGLVGMVFTVAFALGTGARARQDRIVMLEERSRRLAEEQSAIATRERQRIAREMHDILAHSMSMIAIQAEAGPVVVRTDPDKAERVFDTISVTARESLTQLRRILGVLRSEEAALKPQPGLDDLPSLVAGVRRSGLTVTLVEDGEPPGPVPKDLAVTVYRIVQESLTNVVKHAAASSVQVRLRWHDRRLRLEVSDDGQGPAGPGSGLFEPGVSEPSALEQGEYETNRQRTGGHGLIGMRERVGTAGQVTFGTGADGSGFQVTAELPIM